MTGAMTLRAGFGKVELTPPLGLELGGFGPIRRRRATEVRTPIWARALAVAIDGARWVLVSCDLLGVDAATVARVRRQLTRLGLDADQVCVHATHTHSAPAVLPEFTGWGDVDGRYYAALTARIALAAELAVADLRLATVATATVDVPAFAFDRVRHAQPDPHHVARHGFAAAPTPGGSADDRLCVMRFDRDDRSVGLAAHFACHPVICCESTTAVHGDFPGEAIARVELARPNTFGVFLQGALGDVNPLYAHGETEESLRMLDIAADRFAAAILDGLERAEPQSDAVVASAVASIDAELAWPSRDELAAELALGEDVLRRAAASGDDEPATMAGVQVLALHRLLERLGRGGACPIAAQTLRLGDTTLTAFDLELFHRLQSSHEVVHGDRALLLSTSNGYGGYGPTREAFGEPEGKYAVTQVPRYLGRPPFTPEIEDVILVVAGQAVTASRSGPAAPRRRR